MPQTRTTLDILPGITDILLEKGADRRMCVVDSEGAEPGAGVPSPELLIG